LIVEDNFYNVVPLKMLLRMTYSIQIERAENGKLGVEAYERNATKTCCRTYFKLIFMDIQMPIMNGYDSARGIIKAFERLAKEEETSHIKKPVIFAMTA
jgi:CheY-like chemotaxis protein